MRIKMAIPELTLYPNGFPNYWLKKIFHSSQIPSYQIQALITSYVRLVEAAYRNYRDAHEFTSAYWDRKGENAGGVPLGAIFQASSSVEACIGDMHRAIRCMRRIRSNRAVPQAFRDQLADKPTFIADRIADRIRDFRDAVQHVEEKVISGEIPEGSPFLPMPGGSEVPVDDEPGQTLKTIDRVTIGGEELLFAEIHTWLVEMGGYADKIAAYDHKLVP